MILPNKDKNTDIVATANANPNAFISSSAQYVSSVVTDVENTAVVDSGYIVVIVLETVVEVELSVHSSGMNAS